MNQKETVFRGVVITVDVEQVPLPNGTTARYEIVRHPGGAAVVAAQTLCLLGVVAVLEVSGGAPPAGRPPLSPPD